MARTALFTGLLTIPAGTNESQVFAVSGGATMATAEFDGTVFPIGVTSLEVSFSFDGGVSFTRVTSVSWNGPSTILPNGRGGTNSVSFVVASPPTNVKFKTTAPSTFQTQATLSFG